MEVIGEEAVEETRQRGLEGRCSYASYPLFVCFYKEWEKK
jgi:hypothetical protein